MIRVIRVGGSLLTWNDFLPTFRDWLDQLPAAANVFVTGGGPWVELLRHAAKRFDLPESEAHWNCVKAMSVTAELLANATGFPLVMNFDELASTQRARAVFDAYTFLRSPDSQSPEPLPASWRVTSDSISARVATSLQAGELILLKSQDPPSHDITRLSELNYVDPYFETASSQVPKTQFVNLRRLAS